MSILIDTPVWKFRGVKHAHMISDVSYDELHIFAASLGFPLRAFQGDHYDLPEYLVPVALGMGATQVDPRELARRLRGAGLRRPRGTRPER